MPQAQRAPEFAERYVPKYYSDSLPKYLNKGSQSRHVPGSHNFDPTRSPLNNGVDPKQLLDGIHSRKYPITRINPKGNPIVNFGKPIGSYNGNPTTFGTVHYGKNGAPIVPANPVQY